MSLKRDSLWGLFLQEKVDETAKNTTQEKILKLIKDNPSITQTQMANTLRLTRDGISYNIKQMKNNGVIERIGATKIMIYQCLSKLDIELLWIMLSI